jgi:hypothetical protein
MILSKLDGTIPVAHLNIRGATILAVFLDAAFEDLSPAGRADTYAKLQAAAAREGLRGEVVAVWEDHLGRTRFMAPPQQRPFFQVVNWGQLRAQANGTIQISAP